MARIEVIEPEAATGLLAEVYDELISSRGKIAEIHKIQSLNPQSIRDHMSLYMTVMFARSPLSRSEREMMAVVVSSANGCEYCTRHHGEALDHFWRDAPRVESLAEQGASLEGLSNRERTLCTYADIVTREPSSARVEEATAALRAQGLEDRAILDASLVVAYFNFVNRIVLALGVELEADAGGYRYE